MRASAAIATSGSRSSGDQTRESAGNDQRRGDMSWGPSDVSSSGRGESDLVGGKIWRKVAVSMMQEGGISRVKVRAVYIQGVSGKLSLVRFRHALNRSAGNDPTLLSVPISQRQRASVEFDNSDARPVRRPRFTPAWLPKTHGIHGGTQNKRNRDQSPPRSQPKPPHTTEPQSQILKLSPLHFPAKILKNTKNSHHSRF